MAPDGWQTFAELIERGDVEGVVAAMEALDESARTKLATPARTLARDVAERDRVMGGGWYTRHLASETAVFATTGSAAAARLWFLPWSDPDLMDRLLALRPRAWREDWAERVLDRQEMLRASAWRTVRRAVRGHLIGRPAVRGYVVGAAQGMYDVDDGRHPPRPLLLMLREDPDWLRDELWHLFEVEEAALSSLDAWPHDDEQSWTAALIELAREGEIARDRLLDEALAALRRDFSPYNARWFWKLYEALAPRPEEHLARLDALLALLASSDAAVAAFALRVLAGVEEQLPPDELIEAIGPALLLPVKGHAIKAIKLLARVLERSPEHARVAAPVLAEALAHESRDVQEEVLGVVDVDAIDQARLAELAGAVDPAVRPRLVAREAVRVVGPAVDVPGRRDVPRDVPRLDTPLDPPRDAEELFDRLAPALERADDPDELELMLDGLSRLAPNGVDRGRVRALTERALALAEPWEGRISFWHARDALAFVILRRFGDTEQRGLRLGGTGRTPREALAQRIRELGAALADGAEGPLLSAPTHAGGWIDPAVAVERVAALRHARELDLAQMVLRLAPEGRDEARRAAERLDGEAAAVIVRALGGEPRRSRLAIAWAAAEQGRAAAAYVAPADPPRQPGRWDRHGDGGVGPASPATLLELEASDWAEAPNGIERWLTTVWPANREAVYRIVVRRLWIDLGTRQYGIGDVLEVLLDPREPIGEQAGLAIALNLGASDVIDRALAVDVTIAALHSRRLDGGALGAALGRLLREQPDAVPARWAGSLSDVASASALAAHDVQIAIERVLGLARAGDRRRLLGVVELLRRLAVEAGAQVMEPGAREWLGAITGRSKVARAAGEALAVTGDGVARSREAAALAD